MSFEDHFSEDFPLFYFPLFYFENHSAMHGKQLPLPDFIPWGPGYKSVYYGIWDSTPISYPESSGFLVSGATPGRLWGHRILLPQDFCGKTMETVTKQPIKKIKFFRCPQSLPGVAPLTKKPEDSGYEIDSTPT